jgi:hypothetical protein
MEETTQLLNKKEKKVRPGAYRNAENGKLQPESRLHKVVHQIARQHRAQATSRQAIEQER